MATITGATNDKVFSVQKWYGLNEHPDGDTRLRMGEASTMVNWRITRDGNLKLRPGQEFVAGLNTTYTAVYDTNLSQIGTFNGSDQLMVYSAITAMAPKGTITMSGADVGIISEGRLALTSNLGGGILGLPTTGWTLENGVLTNTGTPGTAYTIYDGTENDLYTALTSLADEAYLYCKLEGVVYAMGNGSIVVENGKVTLSGYKVTAESTDPQKIAALWSGVFYGKDVLLAACEDGIWSLWDAEDGTFTPSYLGYAKTDKGVHFFMFDGTVYILNGYEYYKVFLDGGVMAMTSVAGYVPLIATGIGPTNTADAGELTSEYVNLLTNKRRVWISPDGTGVTFQLPEKDIKSIVKITNLTNGNNVTGYTADLVNGTVTFTGTPARAVNSYEIEYSVYLHSDTGHSSVPDYRSQVTSMLYSELYSGTTDTRIFIYGNGTNKTLYSGMDYDGMPRADYFPDQYEVAIGDSNTPITTMVRHSSVLIAYKPTECWSLQHGVVELATGDLTPSIYCVPVNREKGSDAPGQVALVNNSPVTCSGSELYQWGSVSRYSSSIGRDERNAKRISDRIQTSIKEIDFKTCRLWDDNDNQEFYIIGDGMALVWNYAVDAWYRYENFDATAVCSFHGDLYIGSHDGKIRRMSDYVTGDEGKAIPAKWESGAMDFGAANSRKYSASLWVGMKPVEGTSVDVTVVTDRKNTFAEKNLSASKAKVPGQPFMIRTKIKAKKFVFYRLRLSVKKLMLPVTITNVEIKVRMTSEAK